MTAALSTAEQARLGALAQRVEVLWGLAQRRLVIAEQEARRHIDLWGATGLPAGTGAVQREQIEAVLTDPDGAYQRLHRVMDAWAALWSWPITTAVPPPTRAQWLDALESLLGRTTKVETKGGRGLFDDDATWAELDLAEQQERSFAQMLPVAKLTERHPWLALCAEAADAEGFFHWELTFGPVFAEGGFDLQLGNPPWVRPTWDDTLVLAEDDAWFGLAHKPSVAMISGRRAHALSSGVDRYLNARSALAGTSAHLGSAIDRPLLAGTQPDFYRCFMDRTWRSMASGGVV